ncbi:MAG: hypothetical protein M3203_11915 [Actinomycetota bacterium]|nr:hypothetical protein [Actinomycetota bacterium]
MTEDGLDAQHQLGGHLPVGLARRLQAGHGQFLREELEVAGGRTAGGREPQAATSRSTRSG